MTVKNNGTGGNPSSPGNYPNPQTFRNSPSRAPEVKPSSTLKPQIVYYQDNKAALGVSSVASASAQSAPVTTTTTSLPHVTPGGALKLEESSALYPGPVAPRGVGLKQTASLNTVAGAKKNSANSSRPFGRAQSAPEGTRSVVPPIPQNKGETLSSRITTFEEPYFENSALGNGSMSLHQVEEFEDLTATATVRSFTDPYFDLSLRGRGSLGTPGDPQSSRPLSFMPTEPDNLHVISKAKSILPEGFNNSGSAAIGGAPQDGSNGSLVRRNATSISPRANRETIAKDASNFKAINTLQKLYPNVVPERLSTGGRTYRMINVGEAGSYGQFYVAVDDTNEPWAIKVMRGNDEDEQSGLNPQRTMGVAPTETRSAATEMKFLQELSPGLMVQPLKQSNVGKLHFLRMKLMGGSAARILHIRTLPDDTLKPLNRSLLQELLMRLNFMHKKGVTHADIKLENLLLSFDKKVDSKHENGADYAENKPFDAHLAFDERVEVCDFGKAVRGIARNNLGGTYPAPEMAPKKNSWGPKVDVFSAFVCIAEAYRSSYLKNKPFHYDRTDLQLRMEAFKLYREHELYAPYTQYTTIPSVAMANLVGQIEAHFADMKRVDPKLHTMGLQYMGALVPDERDDAAQAIEHLKSIGHHADEHEAGLNLLQIIPRDPARVHTIASLRRL